MRRRRQSRAELVRHAVELWNRRQGRSLPRLQQRIVTIDLATKLRMQSRGGTVAVSVGGHLCTIVSQRPCPSIDAMGMQQVVLTLRLIEKNRM